MAINYLEYRFDSLTDLLAPPAGRTEGDEASDVALLCYADSVRDRVCEPEFLVRRKRNRTASIGLASSKSAS